MAHMVLACADLAFVGFDVEGSEDKSISPNGRLPVMQLYDDKKTLIWETEAMLHHLARMNPKVNLHGTSQI